MSVSFSLLFIPVQKKEEEDFEQDIAAAITLSPRVAGQVYYYTVNVRL